MLLNLVLHTDRLLIRNIDPKIDNLANYLRWMQNKASNPFILGIDPGLSMSDLVKYVTQKNFSTSALLLGLYDKKSGIHIGNIKLEPIEDYQACLGILIGEVDFRGKSFGYESISKILELAKSQLSLTRIYLGVDAMNFNAIELYKRIGFQLSTNKSSFKKDLEMEYFL
jgi:RimJ/RimL family protein N-acetyltransferase